jgi:hypothetical protein
MLIRNTMNKNYILLYRRLPWIRVKWLLMTVKCCNFWRQCVEMYVLYHLKAAYFPNLHLQNQHYLRNRPERPAAIHSTSWGLDRNKNVDTVWVWHGRQMIILWTGFKNSISEVNRITNRIMQLQVISPGRK